MDAVAVDSLDLSCASSCAQWDDYVRTHADATVFHLTAWGKAVAEGCGQTPVYLMARKRGLLVGLLPLICVRSPLFGVSLISNGFAVRGGPLADSEDVYQALDAAGWACAQRLGVGALEYRSSRMSRPLWHRKEGVYANFRRGLSDDSEKNLKAIPRKQRAEVRRSLTFDLCVRVGRGDRDVTDHFRVYAQSVRNLGTPVFPPALFKSILKYYGQDADILTVLKDGRPLSSVLSLYFRGDVLPYYGGGVQDARRWRANDHMYWMLMEHARTRGCSGFDFGRSKTGSGAFAFKKNWGFEPEALTYEYRSASARPPSDLNPNNPKYRLMIALWRKLPLCVANHIGPWIAKGIG